MNWKDWLKGPAVANWDKSCIYSLAGQNELELPQANQPFKLDYYKNQK